MSIFDLIALWNFISSLSPFFFFSDYDILREHFREEHYLCEEAHCIEAKFTNAFRSDIDLKGHVAKEHSKTMKRSQAKQARTIDIEINYAPRQTAGRGGRGKETDFSAFAEFKCFPIHVCMGQNHLTTSVLSLIKALFSK